MSICRHIFLILGLLLVPACGRNIDKQQPSLNEPRIERFSHGPIKITITAEPPNVYLNKDIFLTIKITAPSEMDVRLPPLNDRLNGFILNGSYDTDSTTDTGTRTFERRARITPILAEEYRIAPITLTYTDRGRSPAQDGWFFTRPITFDLIPPITGDPGDNITENIKPVWIPPSRKTVFICALLGLVIAGLIAIVILLLKRARHEIQLRRMSPRERALKELDQLMAMRLIEKDQVKRFYIELTLVVRRYIERLHGIRAPEQTTQEFLIAVSNDSRFSMEVVKKLKTFMEAADLVKFASHKPSSEAVDRSITTARDYIEKDSCIAMQADNRTGGN